MVQKYPIRWHQFFHGELNPHELHPGFHRSQQGRVKLGSLSHHPSVVTPCDDPFFPPPNRDLLSGTWPSMFGVQARWAWRTQIPRRTHDILPNPCKWCTLPETDIAPGILVSFWDRHKFRGYGMLVSGSVFTYMNFVDFYGFSYK